MAGTPQGMSDRSAPVAEHGASLHRLAAMLTGDTDSATRLTALALARAPGSAEARELRQATVRAYLRTAPRRTERAVPTDVRDAGDALERLRPRERAVATLRLVEGASTADVARMLRLSPEKVTRLEPTAPGLDAALTAIGDRYALTGPELAAELEPAIAHAPPTPPASRSRWWWAAAAALPLALLAGYALSLDGEESTGQDATVPTGAGAVQVGPVDLGEAGFELDEDGEPPRGAAGLTRMSTLELTPGRSADLTLATVDARFGGQVASFAVLWCDMPPADDPALDPPVGEISVEGSTLEMPCAGTGGEPAVGLDHLVALPASGEAEVRVIGDLPPDGGAVLALYARTDDMAVEPLPDGDLTAGPPVPQDAVVVDEPGPMMPFQPGQRLVHPVELSPTSTIRVWSGRTGAVTVLVDGIPVTDDGDLARWVGGAADWRDQKPDVRDGRWMVYVPGSAREFTIPDDAIPEDGGPWPAIVEVVTDSTEHVQVVATGAEQGTADQAPVPRTDEGGAPELSSGHRLVGAWPLPLDGLERELLDPPEGEDVAWALLGPSPDELVGSSPVFWHEGAVRRAGTLSIARQVGDPSEVPRFLAETAMWDEVWSPEQDLPGGSEPPDPEGLDAVAPSVPGHPEGFLVAYEPVPYEDFDFAAGQVPSTSWSVGEQPEPSELEFRSPVATVTEDDLDEDGRSTVNVPAGPLGAHIETQGRGRIRFEVDGEPVELLGGTDGWWSSWTDRGVVTETPLSYGANPVTGETELTITVEDYDDVRIELLQH